MKIGLKFIVCIIVFAIANLPVSSQNIKRFDRFSSKDGLSQNTILSSFCDSEGFLWFGTMDGLNRYDGYNFQIYKKQVSNPFSLPSNRIVKIWEDTNQFIWIESHDGHYHCLDRTTDRFYSFPIANELKNNTNVRITCFFQLSKHEIWLGTDNSGVYRLVLNESGLYDYTHYSSSEMPAISNNSVRFIISDNNADVWIGTSSGVNKVKRDNGKLIFQHYLMGHSFTCAEAFDNKIWFGTLNHGIVTYDKVRDKFNGETLIRHGNPVTVLKRSRSKSLIIGTENSGITIYDPLNNKSEMHLAGQSIVRVFEDTKGGVWLITNMSGISRFDIKTSSIIEFKLIPQEELTFIIDERLVFFEDRDANIWIGSHGGGLAFYNAKSSSMVFFRNIPKDNTSLSSDVVHSITQDKSGLIWVGTGQSVGGLNKIIPANPAFKQIQPENKMENPSDNVVKGMMQDSKGNMWAATKSGHIYIYNQSLHLVAELKNLYNSITNVPQSHIYSILEDSEGFIWLGSKSRGVAVSRHPLQYYSNYKDITFNRYQHDPLDRKSLSNDLVYSIIQDRRGRIWIGTYGGGVNLVESRNSSNLVCRRFNTENSDLSSNEIRQIYQDKSNKLWIATTFGLNLLDPDNPNRFTSFTYSRTDNKSISYNDVVSIFQDSKLRMWFGTSGGGVNYFKDPHDFRRGFSYLTSDQGLINDAVFGISEDRFGSLWFSTQNGISKYNLESQIFDNFDSYNGLTCSEFNENASMSLIDGRLLFGNTSGVLVVNPAEISSNPFKPPVVFTNFFLFSKEVRIEDANSPLSKNINYTDHIVLKHDQSSFSIEYSALSFFDSKKNQYVYTLENFDEVWYDVKNERKASYTNIPPGDYVFKVKASNWDGTWSETPREIKITVLQPWWNTRFAYFIYLILVISLIEILRRTYLNYHGLQTDLKVEKRVNEIKLQFFTNISHEIRTPLTLILGPLEDLRKKTNLHPSLSSSVDIMTRNSKRILRLVNQLLDFRKIQSQKMKMRVQEVNIGLFIEEICQNFEQLAIQKDITFSYPTGDSDYNAWIDKEKIDSVLFNILSNAFKFTDIGQSIKVELSKNEEFITISVLDKGKGIAQDKLPLIFKRFNTLSANDIDFSGTGIGLAYSYELIKLHHGDITVESSLERGSHFKILIPTGNDHFSNNDILPVRNIKEADKYRSHLSEYNLADTPYKPSNSSLPELKRHNIVIIEDNLEVLSYLSSILSPLFHINQATNGNDGFVLIKKVSPDIIITDVMMPEMDGLSLTKKIKDDFSVSHIPVIMLTAKSDISDQILGIESGAEAYILKPFNSTYLFSIINNLIKQREIIANRYNSPTFSSDIKITDKDEEFMRNTIKCIEDNCQNPNFNVGELIMISNLGRTVFFNKIKGLTGYAPVEFIRKIKLDIAKKHLTVNNCGVAEAAYLSGFNDVKHFSKCFKKEFGINPSECKK